MKPEHYGQDITNNGLVSLATDGQSLVLITDDGDYRHENIALTRDEAIKLMAAIKVWSEIRFDL